MKSTRLLSSPKTFFTVAASIGVATVVTIAAPASAISGPITLNFVCASVPQANNACSTGNTQFSAVVSQVGPSRALFSFFNNGPATSSSITKIDIFDKAQFSLANRVSTSGSGVKFNSSSTLSNTLGNHSFSTSAGSNSTQRKNGINPGDNFDILFNIAPGFRKPFNAVVADLFQKSLSVQLTTSGFGSTETQKRTQVVFNSKVKAVPEPLTMLGSGAALGFGALMKRRSSKLKAKNGGITPVEPTLETVA